MKITFEYNEPVGAVTRRKTIVLGDDLADAPISGFEDAAGIEVQTVQYPRATGVTHLHRGNLRWDFTWTTTRLHASQDAAEMFRITHKQECLKMKGTLKMVLGTKTYSAPAIVGRAETSGSGGVRTITKYQALCDSVS